MRSGVLLTASDGAGTTLVGLLSALMIGGSAAAGRTDIGPVGKGRASADHGKRQHRDHRHQPAGTLARRRFLVLIGALIGVRVVRIRWIALKVLFARLIWP